MTTPHPEPAGYLDAWRSTADDLSALLGELTGTDWQQPTDCPAWTVRDIVAHLAAIEADLAEGVVRPGQPAARDVADPAFTQAGVDRRADRTPQELVAELTRAVTDRDTSLRDNPPELDAPAWQTPSGPGWDWRTLLRNRAIDLWVHEQDIRRATDRPGGLDAPGALLTARVFASALPMVIGRRVRPPAGTVVSLQLDGISSLLAVDVDGRCSAADAADARPDVELRLGREALTLLAAGRRTPEQVVVDVRGDVELGSRILRALTLTP